MTSACRCVPRIPSPWASAKANLNFSSLAHCGLARWKNSPFEGSPAKLDAKGNVSEGDWTYCGLQISNDLDGLRYRASEADILGTPQLKQNGTAPNDYYRFFWQNWNDCTLALDEHKERVYTSNIFWLPSKPVTPIEAEIILKRLNGPGVVIGPAKKVTMAYSSFNGNYHAVTNLGYAPSNAELNMRNIGVAGLDALVMPIGERINFDYLDGNIQTPVTAFRLVGCTGTLGYFMIAPNGKEIQYYTMVHGGPRGGPLVIDNANCDAEGADSPAKGGFYFEPSLDGKSSITLKNSSMEIVGHNGIPVVDLVDAPVSMKLMPLARILIRTTRFLWTKGQPMDSFVRCNTPSWYGSIYDVRNSWNQNNNASLGLTYGPIHYTGTAKGPCHLVTYHTDIDSPQAVPWDTTQLPG